MKFLGKVGNEPMNKWLNFGGDLNKWLTPHTATPQGAQATLCYMGTQLTTPKGRHSSSQFSANVLWLNVLNDLYYGTWIILQLLPSVVHGERAYGGLGCFILYT